MANDEANESTLKRRARRRLIGAIALVLLAVIVLPMVFDAEKKPLDTDISIQIPNQDAVVVKGINPGINATPGAVSAPSALPAGAAPATAADDKAAQKGAEKKTVEKAGGGKGVAEAPPAVARSEAKPESGTEPKAEIKLSAKAEDKPEVKRSAKDLAEEKRAAAILNAKDATAKTEKTAAAAGAYAVQVGAFATDEKVQEARDKLSAAGIKTYTEKLDTKEGERTRLRAGPFAAKDAADEARDKIRALGFAGAQVVAR